jgi:hypothetical protein
MSANLPWWEKLPITLAPRPHIPEKEILANMPEELKPQWRAFIYGSQALALDDGDAGIYPHDFFRFLKIRNLR